VKDFLNVFEGQALPLFPRRAQRDRSDNRPQGNLEAFAYNAGQGDGDSRLVAKGAEHFRAEGD
jgi:hypothetical protein